MTLNGTPISVCTRPDPRARLTLVRRFGYYETCIDGVPFARLQDRLGKWRARIWEERLARKHRSLVVATYLAHVGRRPALWSARVQPRRVVVVVKASDDMQLSLPFGDT